MTTLAVRFYEVGTASSKWLGPELKVSKEQRRVLTDTQAEYDQLGRQMPAVHFRDLGRQKWRQVRAEYEKSHDAGLLEQLAKLGDKGSRYGEEMRDKKHAIRAAQRKLSGDRGCAPIYAALFAQAAQIVRERVRETERSEREAGEIVELPWAPSELLKSLVNLASDLQNRAAVYEAPDNLAFVQPPRDVLGEFWPAIANSERKK